MTGNIWMCSHLLDTEDLEFGMHEFITYKIPDDEDDIDDAEEEGGDVLVKMKNKIIFLYLSI